MDLINPILNVIDPVRIIVGLFTKTSEQATEAKEDYAKKLEIATGDDVFKYVLLINMAALDGYVAQTRLQAAQSFRLSRIVAMIGFLLLAVGIGAGFYLSA